MSPCFGNLSVGMVGTHLRSVTWTKVSLKDAKIRATPKTSSPVKISSAQPKFDIVEKIRYLHGSEDREKYSLPCARPSFLWGPF